MQNPFSEERQPREMPPLSVRDFIMREISKGRSPEDARKAWILEHRRRLDEVDRAFKQGFKTPRQAEAPRQQAPREEAPRPSEPLSGKTGYHGWIDQEVAKGKTKAQADQSWDEERKRRIRDLETGTKSSTHRESAQPDRAPRTKNVETVIDKLRDLLKRSSGDEATRKIAKADLQKLFTTIHPDVHRNKSEAEQEKFKELTQAATEILQTYTQPQKVSSQDKIKMLKKLDILEETL